jgi:acyl CoA:acetate/3-ketoacid CoA transferase alpha subunit/acyl CoA:acetate/3-ketoacid CoA transferase beta subunit
MMKEEFKSVLDKVFSIPENEGEDKVCDFKEAVGKFVKPGMVLYLPFTHVRCPTALTLEVARQFWGQKPGFTLVTLAVNWPAHILVYGGLVKKLVCGATGDPYLSPKQNKIFQDAYINNKVEFEDWSLLTLTQRLKAGALGLPFTSTKSLIGSEMERELGKLGSFQAIDDPFGSKQKVGLVKALNPDLALVHGCIADRYGNTVFLPPWGDNLYGALGAKKGVLVTVEKIVPTDVIRKYSYFVKIPGYLVKSVSEVPFGAHPSGLANCGMPEFEGYIEDFDYFRDTHDIGRDAERLDSWIKDMVLDSKDYWDYLRKIGYERLIELKGKSQSDFWRYEIESLSEELDPSEKCNEIERTVVISGRVIADKVREHGYRTILAGAGISLLAPMMGLYRLKEEGYDAEAMVEVGMYGMSPRPAYPYLISHTHFPSSKILTDSETLLGILMGGETNKALGSLAAAEIDKHGNINTTKILPPNLHLIGSGGANDICSAAQEVVATGILDRRRFLEKVSYVTSPGGKVKTLVTNMGVCEKLGDDDEFTLTTYYRDPSSATVEEIIDKIKQNCGWELKVSPQIKEILPPTVDELRLLRLLDARRVFLGRAQKG